MRVGRWVNGQYLPTYATNKMNHAELLAAARLAGRADALSGFEWGRSLGDNQCEDCRRAYDAEYDKVLKADVAARG
jgi:hypothetical protein